MSGFTGPDNDDPKLCSLQEQWTALWCVIWYFKDEKPRLDGRQAPTVKSLANR